MLYLEINVDAALAYVDAMKDTRLGQDIQAAMAPSKEGKKAGGAAATAGAALSAIVPLLDGLGKRAAVGLTIHQDPKTLQFSSMDMIVVIPAEDTDKARANVGVMAGMGAAQMDWAWKDEPEGQDMVHVATSTLQAPPPKPGVIGPKLPTVLPAYSFASGALIIGSSADVVHRALKTAATGPSLASKKFPDSLLQAVNKDAFLWGIGTAQMPTTTAGAPVFDFNKYPFLKKMMDANQGSAFWIDLKPEAITMSSLAAYDPSTEFGKMVAAFQPGDLKVPPMGFGGSFEFVDMADLPHFAAMLNAIIDLEAEMFTNIAAGGGAAATAPWLPGGKAGGAAPGNPGSAVLKGMSDAIKKWKGPISDIISGCGGEMAFDFGPIAMNAGAAPGMPKVNLMVEQGSDPRLQKGMMALLRLISDASGMKWYPTQIKGIPVQILGPESSPIRPVYGVVNGFQILGLSKDSITTPIYLSAGVHPGASLAADPKFAAMTKALGGKSLGLIYIDPASIIQIIEMVAQMSTKGKAAGPAVKVGFEIANDIGQLGFSYYPVPGGLASKGIFTMNPNAAPPADAGAAGFTPPPPATPKAAKQP